MAWRATARQFIILACRICGVYEAPLTSAPLRQDIATFPLTSGGGAVWEARTTGFAVKRLDWMTGRLASLSKGKFVSFVIQSRRLTANSVVSAFLTVNLFGGAITLGVSNAGIDRGGERCPVRRSVVSCGRQARE